jgi:hypothetical protein
VARACSTEIELDDEEIEVHVAPTDTRPLRERELLDRIEEVLIVSNSSGGGGEAAPIQHGSSLEGALELEQLRGAHDDLGFEEEGYKLPQEGAFGHSKDEVPREASRAYSSSLPCLSHHPPSLLSFRIPLLYKSAQGVVSVYCGCCFGVNDFILLRVAARVHSVHGYLEWQRKRSREVSRSW